MIDGAIIGSGIAGAGCTIDRADPQPARRFPNRFLPLEVFEP
jgi:hypothetical protein